jgi:hypothetical protein
MVNLTQVVEIAVALIMMADFEVSDRFSLE